MAAPNITSPTTAEPIEINSKGGDVILVEGSDFASDLVVELLQGGEVIGTGLIVEPEIDLESTKVYVGMPAAPVGSYDLRITTSEGSDLQSDAVESVLVSEEYKTEKLRLGYGPWNTLSKYLRS